jgi:ubiquinone/menaquinone biosynthesis C-methylase UbiE
MMGKDTNRSFDYNYVASVYDQRYERSEYGPVLELLLNFVGNTSNRILEVGCGTGHWLKELEQHSHSTTGLDPAIEMLRTAGQKQSQTKLVQGKAEVLPFFNSSFDRLFCINAFHHFTDKKAFIKEARRIVRPGGGVLIIGLDPHTGLDRWWIYEYFPQVVDIDKNRYPSTSSIRSSLAAAGFTDCNTIEVLHWPIELNARSALESGRLTKTTTSQLTILTDAEYETGINKLVQDIETAEATGQVLKIGADLRLFATTAWLH